MKSRVLPTLWGLLASAAFAQAPSSSPDEVVVQVIEANTAEPLGAVSITIDGSERGGVTDEVGAYAIRGLSPGEHSLTLTHVGYLTSVERIQVGGEGGASRVTVTLTPTVLQATAITVSSTRAWERETPAAFTNIDRGHIERTLTTADVPTMLSEVPNVHTWSLAGNGIGYTYLSIRGFQQERIAVMVNGIPLNDPETHQVYWVNMPDLMESVEDIQVQRGVGSSVYGASAIGGSVNLVTGTFRQTSGIAITGVTGSYGTRKLSAEYNSGMVNGRYQMYGRFSRIVSDGYRDQSWSELWSYYFGVARHGESTNLRINLFGGNEQTHFAFFGATKEQLAQNRRANPFSPYEGAKDDFTQPHYQLIHEWQPSDEVMVTNSVYFIKGDGFFQDQHFDADFNPIDDIRRDHLDISHYGWIPRLEWEHGRGALTVGGEARTNATRHWGEVLGGELVEGGGTGSLRSPRLYDYDARKTTLGGYVHELFRATDRVSLTGDVSLLLHRFDVGEDRVVDSERIDDFNYVFLMPRGGVNFNINESVNAYGSFSVGRREPALTNLFDPAVFFGDADRRQAFKRYDPATNRVSGPKLEAEKLNNWELGVGYTRSWLVAKASAYRMDFSDEIVATGTVLGIGTFDHRNAAKSTHQGVELSATAQPLPEWKVSGDVSFSGNSLDEFEETSLEGNDVPNFPDRLVNVRLTYQRRGLWGSLRLRHVGEHYFDLQNTPGNVVEAYTTAHLRLSYRVTDRLSGKLIEPSFEIDNLFDSKHDSWGGLFFGTPTWIPAAGRNFQLALRVTL